MGTFKLGINMAGAVSAGAYTAGVLDFLTEALDEWYAAKEAGAAVPRHDVCIEVFSGASAGGMCAAIAACLMQEDFEHITDVTKTGTTNKLYEGWVNNIDISKMLGTDDLKMSGGVSSLLDSTIISQIADYALQPGGERRRKYVSEYLTLFLTLTNLRGIPYGVYQDPNSSAGPDEHVTYHADRLRFEMVDAGCPATAPDAQPIARNGVPLSDAGWATLRSAAMATGAFPIFLASRILNRPVRDYTTRPPWLPLCSCAPDADPVHPDWPLLATDHLQTVNVDGGMINNSPFALNHDYLATLDPLPPQQCENPRNPEDADRAVLTVAPFPAVSTYDPNFNGPKESGLLSVVGSLFSALISQVRFYGESLSGATGAGLYTRFFIAPSGPIVNPQSSLQCSSLGAFGGFLERSFRAHDFQLGRRNCQAFLQNHFVLPSTNAAIAPGLEGLTDAQKTDMFKNFGPASAPDGRDWIQIIPLCGSALKEAVAPVPGTISEAKIDSIVELISGRINALLPFAARKLQNGALRFFFPKGIKLLLSVLGGKDEIRRYLVGQLGKAVTK